MARKILLADDSVTAQNMGRKILTDAGYEVITVNNGSAALKKITEHKPDLIVLDVYMPGYSGLEVCQRIKEKAETARIPVLLTVGKLEPFKPEEARRARADAFVVKPFEASELLAALSKLEDKVIPQPEPYKQGRFAKAVASFERDTETDKVKDADEGWKARLRIPTSPKTNAEPEADYAATQGKGFRDVDVPATKNQASAAGRESEFERPVPAGLPHDITPEEIAAITAAAARLSGAPFAVPSSVQQISPEERIEPELETKVETTEVAVEEAAPVTFASAPETAETLATEAVEPTAQEFSVEHAPASVEIPEVATTEPVAEEPTVETNAEVVAASENSATEAIADVSATPVQPSAEAFPTAEGVAPWPGGPSDVAMPAETQPVPPTGDDEVMAALQNLIPSTPSVVEPTNGQPKEEVSNNGSAAAIAAADLVVSRAHAAGPRWVAEEVSLASDEAAILLEQEMEKAYAALNPPVATIAAGELEAPAAMHDGAESANTDSANQAAYAMASAAGAGETLAGMTSAGSHPPMHDNSLAESQFTEISVTAVAPPAETTEPSSWHIPATPSAQSTSATVDDGANAITDDSIKNEVVGGTEDMAANWKNIRDSIAGAAAKPAPAKEEFQEVEQVKFEPAATADTPSEQAGGPLSATDPKAIASIVDSVLAELRPKIVEEIARKLAEPKKD